VTLSAFSNEGIENNRSHIDPSRCRTSLSFGNLRKLSRPCVTDTWTARFAIRVSVTTGGAASRFVSAVMSALARTADSVRNYRRVRKVPLPDLRGAANLHRHSITSSARASSVVGISMPSAFAVLRLMTISYFVGACTGRSAGFSPLRYDRRSSPRGGTDRSGLSRMRRERRR
jgi:hypothetical protein